MFEKWFIKNKKLLEENARTENLIDLSVEIERFSTKIDHIEFSSIVWFIWKFWSWKSNFLNQIKTKYSEDSKWFDFDAWKYPDRSNLWENFILEFARQIDQKTFDKVIKQVDWTIDEDKKTLINTFWDIPWLSVIKNFNHFLKTSPAKRNFEVENLLVELIMKVWKKNIYIIVEDIDRSWDNWIFFLETLNYFLKTNEIEKRIIVIVPIWQENYTKPEMILSYSKSLDYDHSYSLREIRLVKFVETLFIAEINNDRYIKWQVISFLEWIFKEFPDQTTMRKIKYILRNANSNYIYLFKKYWEWIDWRLSLVFETAKHIEQLSEEDSYFNTWKRKWVIWWSDSIFSAMIDCVFANNIYSSSTKSDNIYIPRDSSQGVIMKPKTFSRKSMIRLISYDYNSQNIKDSVLFFQNDDDRSKSYAWIIRDYLD